MSSGKLCYECLTEKSKLYCPCNQIFLCYNCIDSHKSENCLIVKDIDDIKTKIIDSSYIIEEEVKQKLVLSPEDQNLKIEIIEKLLNVIADIKAKKVKLNKIIDNSFKFSIYNTKDLSNYGFNLTINQTLENMPETKYIYLQYISDNHKNTWIYKVDLRTMNSSRLFKYNDKPISNTLILESNNCLYFIGGHAGFEIVTDISKYDLNNNQFSKIGSKNHKKFNYDCVIYKNKIFFIGGRISNTQSREILYKVTPFNIETEKYENDIPLNKPRYRTSGVIHKSKLWVVSTNVNGYAETLNLDEEAKFKETSFPIICLTDCEMVSVDNYIYFLNLCEDNKWRIGKINENLESEIIKELNMEGKAWRKRASPVYFDNCIFFTGEVTFNKEDTLCLEVNILVLHLSDFSVKFETINFRDDL
ncbi:hypothetical protein SteCoe_24033 [Stentor coeruleus]|uniref:B box-type domain-containing protein n=1 Tax=Stentor coeruleus TaxID=5963 RepID=A0A1R2BIN4_9CILI|nr:hypothetical protein SteCoe_24033 [Stentor coeruleus]